MAKKLREHEVPPANGRGYYYSPDQEQIGSFIRSCIEEWKSVTVQLHVSALVKFRNEVTELHGQNHQVRELDIAMGDSLLFHIEEMFAFLEDPETFYNKASGGSLLSILNYWVLIFKTVKANDKLDEQIEESEHTSSDEESAATTESDPFLTILARCFIPVTEVNRAGKRVRKKKATYEEELIEWIRENVNPFDYTETRINPSLLPMFAKSNPSIQIICWSVRGINLFSNVSNLEEPYANLVFNESTRRWRIIRSLRGFMGNKPRGFSFCIECKRVHGPNCPERPVMYKAKTKTVKPNSKIPSEKLVFRMYADFEAYQDSRTGLHTLSGFTLIALVKDEVFHVRTYSGANCDVVFFDEVEKVVSIKYQAEALEQESVDYIYGGTCERCSKYIVEAERVGPYRSYITGNIGLYHKKCWDNVSNSCVIYFHNFKGYDSHHILAELVRRYQNTHYLAKTMEKIDSAAVMDEGVKFKFLDTLNYFSTSLQALSGTISNFKYTPKEHQYKTKTAFPIYWFDMIEKLNEPIPLNEEAWQDKVGNQLADPKVILEQASNLNFTLFKEWHDFYCARDTWILLEVFENFRDVCYTEEGVDPSYFLGAPSLTWYLAVRECGEKMWTIQDTSIYQVIQSQIRGGISQACFRHEKAYDEDGWKVELKYLDVNALYSWCMMQQLPTEYVCGMDSLPENWDTDDEHQYMIFGDFYLEDYDHESEEYELIRDMPPMPHKYEGRLCTTMLPKEDYLVSSVILPFWLSMGIKIKQIKWVYKFKCDTVLKSYVEKNITERNKYDKSDPRNNFRKLLNNALYGKTCENKFKYRRFVSYVLEDEANEDNLQNSIEETIKKVMFLGEKECFIETPIKSITLDKPIQLGFTILEWAKLRIYSFWYNVKQRFRNRVQLIYTDTDSLLMSFHVPSNVNIFETMMATPSIEIMLDLWPLTPVERKGVAGYLSDELAADEEIDEVVALRAKCYSYVTNKKSIVKNKGITKTARVVEKGTQLGFDDYKTTLIKSMQVYVHQFILRSKNHKIFTKKQKKLALTTLDLKRYICEDGISTKPWDNYTVTISPDMYSEF